MTTAGAALPLTGRYAPMAAQSLRGLSAWARHAGADLTVEDCGDDPRAAAATTLRLADRCELLFGPYGSGAMRAVAEAFADRPEVIWNHGGAAVERTGARMVDVLAPAGAYWAGLPEVWRADGVALDRVAVLHSPTGFGAAVADGAVTALRRAGHAPHLVAAFSETSAGAAARAALEAGATAVVGCGRFEDDVALIRSLAGRADATACVAAGVAEALAALGPAVVGTVGPVQWSPHRVPPVDLGPDAGYPAAQALAAGLIAREVWSLAGGGDADAVWEAARRLRTRTFLGDFAVDGEGRQTAHRPDLVRWVAGPDGPRRVPAIRG